MKDYTGDITALQPHEKATLSRTHRYRGVALHQQGEFDLAIEEFNRAIEIMPEAAWTYFSRGLAYEAKGELDLALKDFNTTIQRRSDYTRPYRDRGRIYRRKGDYDKAIADFNTVMEMSTHVATLGRAYYGRGRVYLEKGDFKQAIEDLSQAIHFDALPGHTFYYRGIAWLRLQAWENARADFVTARKKKEDIGTRCQREFGGVQGVERAVGVQLPGDITALLLAADTHRDAAAIERTDVKPPDSTPMVQGVAAR